MFNKEEVKGVLAVTASISTLFQFLAGTLVCQKIVKNKSCGDMSGLPFVCGLLSTCLWLRYGFLIQEHSIILVNTVGATLHLAYVLTFYTYSIKKSVIVRQFLICVLSLLVVLGYTIYEQHTALVTKYVGLLCCVVSIIFFASPLTSLIYVIKMKSADSLPFPIIFMSLIVTLQWFMYGVVLEDHYIQVPNFLGCVLSAFQLSLFYIYPKVRTVDYSALHNYEL